MNLLNTQNYSYHLTNAPQRMLPSFRTPMILISLTTMLIILFLGVQTTQAVPYFARKYAMSCVSCHVQVPKLNEYGEAFFARNYRLPNEEARSTSATVPFAAWISGRYEKENSKNVEEAFLPKVELISGGPIKDTALSYFVEWRIVSRSVKDPGVLKDRGGRFEDIFLNLGIGSHTFTVGQYRALRQVDVSRRLSASEPALFSTKLAGDETNNKRLLSLRAFSPSGRSPSISYQLHSVSGDAPSDGFFHAVTIPFGGEISLPLSPGAKENASFELEGKPKGVFLESFYRKGLNSIGIHAFIDDDRWLFQGLGVVNIADVYITGGVGADKFKNTNHTRLSLEGEYITAVSEWIRSAVGFRVEQVTNAGRDPAYIPYLLLTGPNTSYTFRLTARYRAQKDNSVFTVDVGTLF